MEPTIVPVVSYKKYIVGGVLLLIIASGVYAYWAHFVEKPIVAEKPQETQTTTSTAASVATTTAPAIIAATTSTVSTYQYNDGISDEERSLVVEAKVRMFEILSSKDIAKIRAYLDEGTRASGMEKELSDISNLSDKNLLSMVNMIIKLGFPEIKTSQDLRNILLSDKALWTKDTKNGFKHVSIKIDSPVQGAVSGTLTLEAFKFGNVWY